MLVLRTSAVFIARSLSTFPSALKSRRQVGTWSRRLVKRERTITMARSLVALAFMAGALAPGSLAAQVLLCPEVPSVREGERDNAAKAKQLLERLTIALDLHGHRGIDEAAVMEAHAETPSALLSKLGNVADRCALRSIDLDSFYEALPDLRKAFLGAIKVQPGATGEPVFQSWTEAERIEQSIDLSVRELWRKLWFRPAKGTTQGDDRFAVIVASPEGADSGWEKLGEHQRHWKDAYFQLHEPYYHHNPHHAIVVGRRLPRDQAERLRDYVIELGMAGDSYVWPLPKDGQTDAASPVPTRGTIDTVTTPPDDVVPTGGQPDERTGLDLSVLKP